MDPISIWTALGVIIVAGGGIIGVIRKGDAERITGLDKQLTELSTQVAEKAHKDELERIENRFEKDIYDLRQTMNTGFDKLDTKMDRVTDLLLKLHK